MAENSFWDNRYSENASVYGTEPNVYLKDKIDPLESGSILFPAEGEGRNAIYAATRGWNVYAYDYSSIAREKALKQADAAGVKIQYEVCNTDSFQTNHQFDAIALIYAHLPEKERKALHQKAIQWLKPGGFIILECFSKAQLQYPSGGPKDVSMLYDTEELKKDFEEFSIIELVQLETILNEGPFHQGKASVVRFFAQNKQ